MKTKLLLKFIILTTLFLASNMVSAQIGINTTAPLPDSMLEIASSNKGILIPRVSIPDLNNISPITGGSTESLLVYNTNVTTVKGYYYWDGAKWQNVHGNDWKLLGNVGTNPSNNFIGTIDNTDIVFRTNNLERMRLLNSGVVGIGAAPISNVALRVSNSSQPNGILAEVNSTGISINATQAGDGDAVHGISSGTGISIYGENTGTGVGVYGTSAASHGVIGFTSYTGSSFLIGGVIGWGDGVDGANGVLAASPQPATTKSNMGMRAVSGGTISYSTNEVINVGVNTNATDLGLYVMTEKTSGIRESARFQTNFSGTPDDADARDIRARLAGFTDASEEGNKKMFYGGYFYSGGNNNGSWAYAGSRYNGTNYKIIGNGTVSTVVDGVSSSDAKKIMFAPEAPEVLFEDYGTSKLINGKVSVEIDPIFAKNIVVNDQHPLKVFIQLEGDCNGVYVTNKTKSSFTVKELQGGNSNVSFSWHIVANRKDANGETDREKSSYSNLRFPDAPENIKPQKQKATKIKLPKKNNVTQNDDD